MALAAHSSAKQVFTSKMASRTPHKIAFDGRSEVRPDGQATDMFCLLFGLTSRR
jgi:hypothetical protein